MNKTETPQRKQPRAQAHAAKDANSRLATHRKEKFTLGKAYFDWRANAGKISKTPIADFIAHMNFKTNGTKQRKNLKMTIKRAISVAQTTDSLDHVSTTGRHRLLRDIRVPARFRKRAPKRNVNRKAPWLDEAVWDWFVDIRNSVASVMTPKIVIVKARAIAQHALQKAKEANLTIELPRIDYNSWLYRWKVNHRVVWRKPNARYKVSWPTMISRSRGTWKNNIRIRRLGVIFCGRDIGLNIIGVDEKPLHFNEAGSKNVRTLDIHTNGC